MSAPEWGEERDQNDPENQNKLGEEINNFKKGGDKPMIVLIAGPSGCGKGAISKKIGSRAVIPTDAYDLGLEPNYKQGNDPHNKHTKFSYSLNEQKILKDLKSLMAGEVIKYVSPFTPDVMPSTNICWTKSNREAEITVEPSKVIVVEGIHAFQSEELRKIASMKIFIDCDYDNLLMWKIMRSPWWKEKHGKEPDDPRNFGKDEVSAFGGWIKRSKPTLKKVIEPQRKYADFIIQNNSWEDFGEGLKKIISFVNLYFENKEEFEKKLKENKEESNPENKIKDLEKQLKRSNQQRERERERERESKIYWMVGGGMVGFIFGVLFIWLLMFTIRKKKLKKINN